MSGSCVRVDPPFVEFRDVSVGQVYRRTVTATNDGKTMKNIIFQTPNLKLFKFTAASAPEFVAPGLSVSGLLQFTPEQEEVVRDCLLIHTDDVTIEIPLIGFPRTCSLLTDSVLDFGCVAANSQIISKQHPITNQGSAPGVFQVKYSGDPSVRLSPSSGVIAGGATKWLKVELHTDRPRQIDEKALIKLQNRFAISLTVRAEVVDQRLEVSDLKGVSLSCLWFGPVYFGTSRVKKVVLRNNGPQACDWVCQFQDAAAGTEAGTDLHKSTHVTLLEGTGRCSLASQDFSQVLVFVPKQGRLGPYESTTVAIRFTPFRSSTTRMKRHESSGSRQDYCVFLLFDSVERRHGFTHCSGNSSVELAVTGSGLPVSLVASPSHRFDFPTCVTGQRVDLPFVLQNLCPQLPVYFHFRKLALFTTEPTKGTIAPGQCQDVVLTFMARQQGSFQVCQTLDVLGQVPQSSDGKDVSELELRSFHTLTLQMSAACHGITSAVTKPTGSLPHIRSGEPARCPTRARADVLGSNKTQRGRESSQNSKDEADGGASHRPYRQRTMFPSLSRERYVDTNSAFEEEEEQRRLDRQVYTDFIKQLRQTRLSRIKEREVRQQEKVLQEVDIGIIPAQGLVPPKFHLRDIERSEGSETKSRTKRSCSEDMTSISQKVKSQASAGMGADSSNSQQEADCSRTLTAQELCQVVIGPSLVDFGEVCVESVCVQTLELTNHLSLFVRVQLEVDCPELQGSSPLSHVLPPHSHNTLPLTFQSNKLGSFYRPVSYSVNQQHPGQILVQAQVVPLALELSTTLLVLRPTPTLLAQSGYRSSVTLRNHGNHTAEFAWRPVVTERGVLYSIRPATGTVEPYSELDCEVMWHPSFSSPEEGDFDLSVHEGDTQQLHCVAKLGSTSVQLAEKLVTFGSVPLNMPSARTAVLHNTGQNHAYYQVLDVSPLPGMTVSPCEGVVPSRGQAVLQIHFSPDSIIRFDTRVEIALRNMKSVELRVGGSVEPPNVDISMSHFQFGGVHAGSRRAIPFTLTNHSSAAARVTFNLSLHADFSLQLPPPCANTHSLTHEEEPGVSVVEVQGHQAADCSLVFSPTQAASYDFDLPLTINGVRWPTAPPSPFTSSSSSSTSSSSLSAVSRKHMVQPPSCPVAMVTQRLRRIQATVLCAPLELSPSSLQFHVEPLTPQSDVYTKTVELKAVCEESVCWQEAVGRRLHWWFSCSVAATSAEGRREAELCTVTPSSGSLGPGQSICLTVSIRPEAITTVSGRSIRLSLPLYLGDKDGEARAEEAEHQPYRELPVTVIVQIPSITIHPPQILLTPVPLENSAVATLTLLAVGYPSGTRISAEVDELKREDGTKMQPVAVTFPDGNCIPTQKQNQVQRQEANGTSLICRVSFSSAVPLSLCTTVTFTEQHFNNRFKVKLCAIADNCLLTVWPHMARHRSEQQIVLKTGSTAVKAILQRYCTPSPASGPVSSSSSSFDHNNSTNKNSASDSFADSDSVSSQTSREEEVWSNRRTLANVGIPEFPTADSDEGRYHQSVLLAVERWFSLFGWPNGPHPISVPHTLRRIVTKTQVDPSGRRNFRVSQNLDHRSVVDMLHHLTGKQIPGIPRSGSFSTDIDKRTAELLQQHKAMLAFFRVQGACLWHIKPEYLLDMQEFKHWCSLQSKKEEAGPDFSSVDYESLSKRSWTDVLLQIYKVLVLCRVSENRPKTIPNREDGDGIRAVNLQPVTSNVYSAGEIQLLSWLNEHYQSMRKTVWGAGFVPSARWIVNFDLDLTDGLVLAALLAAYCPYLICSHFRRMYTAPSSLEQILHNNIVVVRSLTALSLNMDIQPTDLSDPNPVQMLMLCVHLYERLPQYLPRHTITLSGGLHSTVSKQVRLKNPSSKHVKYQTFLLGEDAHLFSVPDGSTLTILPKASAELTVQHRCSFLRPVEAVLLLISSSAAALRATTLSFNLRTHVSHITTTNSVKCTSPCYELRVIQLPITNPFNMEAKFRVVLVESTFNPLEPEKKKDGLIQQASCKAKMEEMMSDCGEDVEEKPSASYGEGSEFLSAVRSVCLKPGQADTLDIHYLPFCPGTKYCSVLLLCPQVGDTVYVVKATADLPLPSPLTTRPSSNIVSSAVCASALSLRCKVQQVCEELVRMPLINASWERALAIWGQQSMNAKEHRRRSLTHTLYSSTVRTNTAIRKLQQKEQLLGGGDHSEVVTYSVEVSLPRYFTLPSTVKMPVKEDTHKPWDHPAEFGHVDVPFRFQADRAGHFTCQVVLKSPCDTRVYMLEALVTSQGESIHLDFSSPAHSPVTQNIPVHNETRRDWSMQAEVCGEGFRGPKVLNVPAGTRVCYPLTFHPTAQCTVMGKLSLHNNYDGTEHVFTLRGIGERPLPVDHVVIHCPVGMTTHTQLDVPNYRQNKLTLKVVTDISVVSGSPTLEIKPGQKTPYTLAVSPRTQGKQTGCVSFVEVDKIQEEDKGRAFRRYEVFFSLEVICEPPAPVKVIDVQCAAQSSVAIEIPVINPRAELLMLDVDLSGDDLSGAGLVSVPPQDTFTYKATFSPGRVGKSSGSVVFRSELVGEICYRLELYALPPPVVMLPQACCPLGKCTRQAIPLVNPTAETLEVTVANSNPRNYTLEMDSGRTLAVEPHSSTELGVCFRPSSIGEGNHTAKITFSCPQLQEWCVFLSGRGLNPESQELLSLSSMIGSNASVAIPFKNPTEFPASLSVTLTDEDPSGTTGSHPVTTDREVFSIPLRQTEGIQISEGASFDVPVVFVPDSMELQHVWLCISLKPLGSSGNNSNFSPDKPRSEQDLPTICWIRPLRGIPVEVPVDNSPLGVVQCDAGCQLERKVDVLLRGSVPGNGEQEVSGVTAEDFLCEVRSNGEAERSGAEDCLSASIQAARRNPETGNVTLTLHLVYTPLRPCRHSVVLAVRSVSGRIWKFPIILVATEPQVDDVILTEATELDKTSAGGVPLTTILDSRAALDQRGDSSSRAACSPVNEPQQSVTSHDFRPPSLPR
ncbi:cilia and flagella-associated protein 47-like isoform X2 [Scophthalmus maximus]|uniref:cilia and flagella-associated protein 47-like isoform X2 n=1 Tax=Scophthalmus maximus TaxID=52904 RepID=UPI001FA84B50|nr:cilia and flagella-associated protein 47-like isoform X2 [Scophthalmus maximus]